jgi:hypothetical protein
MTLTMLGEMERNMAARLDVVRMTARDVSQHVNDDDDALDLLVDDVLSLWDGKSELSEVWRLYANAVEYAPEGSPSEYREGFVPDGSGDLDSYFHAVWGAKVDELKGALMH